MLARLAILAAVFIPPTVVATDQLNRANADTVVVCPAVFREAIKPWVTYRSGQGHVIRVVESQASASELRNRIRNETADARLDAILLIGDTGSPTAGAKRRTDLVIPTHYVPARVITKFGGEKMIASDNPYADVDSDQIPDVPIGRLPADSPDELIGMIGRIIDYESSRDLTLWRRKINVVAGVGGFGGMVDGMIESTTKMFLTSGIPAGYQTSLTQASWSSPYCPDPRLFRETTVERMNEGCLFWIYMGHGHARRLDRLKVPGNQFPILSVGEIPQIDCLHHAPVALFFSCYTAAYDAPQDCLAEELIRREGGPVAVLGGSRVTMPYAMATLGSAMLDECFEHRRQTLGEMFYRAKLRMVATDTEDSRRRLLDSLGLMFGTSNRDLVAERYEHLHLFNLLGDPLLRIKHPREADISAPKQVGEGTEVSIQVDAPIAGRATVELVVRRDKLKFRPMSRGQYDSRDRKLNSYQKVYRQANDQRLATVVRVTDGTPFEVRLELPPGVVGPCHARVFVEGAADFAMGSTDILVQRPQLPQPKAAKMSADSATQ